MKALFVLFLFCAITAPVFAQSTTVNWNATDQTMDGWGAGSGFMDVSCSPNCGQPSETAAAADMFFSQTTGIGLEYIRSSPAPNTGGLWDEAWTQAAVARGAKVTVVMSCPPASFMSDGTYCSSTGGKLTFANYTAYANFIVNVVQNYQSHNIPVASLAVQNEPNLTHSVWTGCPGGTIGTCIDNFIANYLGPALATAGLNTPLIIGETSGWFSSPDYISTCTNDANCAKYVTIASTHDYGTGTIDGTGVSYCCATAKAPLSSIGSRKVWMTEVNGGFTKETSYDTNMWVYDPSIADAMVWAHNIHDLLTVAKASAWMYWNLTSYSSYEYNDGLSDYFFHPSKRLYVVGNWSKFVRSGWKRIDATSNPSSGIYITSFKDDSSGDFAIVAINQNSTSVNLAVSLTGFPSLTSVTPTLTSGSLNLVDQADVNVLNSDSFSYSLPATSVVTFHGTASSSSTKNVAPPTSLTLTVH